MARKLEAYRFREGTTILNEEQLNFRFFDIDLRLHALELLKMSWSDAISLVQNEGIKRINELIVPILDNAQQLITELQADFGTWMAQEESDFDTWQGQQQGDFMDWRSEREDELDDKLDSIQTLLSNAQDFYDSIQADWAQMESDWDNMDDTVSAKMDNLSDDTDPELGGDLDVNGKKITSSDNGDVLVEPHGTGGTNLKKLRTVTYEAELDAGNSGAAKTIDWGSGNHQKLMFTDDCDLSFTDPPGVGHVTLKMIQDSTGSRVPTWPSKVHWIGGGNKPTLTETPGGVDLFSAYFDGSVYHAQVGLDSKAPTS